MYKSLNSIQELQSFFDFANVFHRRIKSFATIAKPLTDALKNIDNRKNNKPMKLNSEQSQSFIALKKALTTTPILANFQQDAPTIVETDTSYDGLGACFTQIQNDTIRVIEYASRTLKDTEKRYHSNELEVTAVHWTITEKTRLYLLGIHFKLITDNYSTAYIINKAKLSRKFARYVVDLSAFNFEPTYRPGHQNKIADRLSRYPDPKDRNKLCLAVITSPNSHLELAQQSDSYCKHIFKKLSMECSTENVKQVKDSYKIINNIPVNFSDPLKLNYQLVVPHSC